MENCTIYSHAIDFGEVVKIVKENLPKAKVKSKDEGLRKSLEATISGGFFSKSKSLRINYRQRQNPSYKLDEIECGLTQNLAGMVGFIQNFPADNEALRSKFLAKVMAANSEMAFIAEPEINPKFEAVLRKITSTLNAFLFVQPSKLFNASPGQHFVDKNLDLILDTQGKSAIQDLDVTVEAKYKDAPETSIKEDQIQRKKVSEAFLNTHGVKVNAHLPTVGSEEDTELRSVSEVIDRAYALMITAVKGEGVEQAHLERAVKEKSIRLLSPQEEYIFNADSLSDQERGNATWRYESLNVILWALGKLDVLSYPDTICDVKKIVGLIFQPTREDFQNSVQLRSKKEILDELDKIYRIHWACVDARIKGGQVSGNVNPSVVYERHYALNWLTNYNGEDWDDVKTHT
ncbi:MAG: DUF4272 domain-containing protein [Saprospiraceae bacterium]|nr:DUF4272 domain-containing protein [Saprospiraceae bacterium]